MKKKTIIMGSRHWTQEELVHVDAIEASYGLGNLNFHLADGETPLTKAIKNQNFDLARVMVRMGALIHNASKHGQTPLSLADELRNIEFLAFLYDHGA